MVGLIIIPSAKAVNLRLFTVLLYSPDLLSQQVTDLKKGIPEFSKAGFILYKSATYEDAETVLAEALHKVIWIDLRPYPQKTLSLVTKQIGHWLNHDSVYKVVSSNCLNESTRMSLSNISKVLWIDTENLEIEIPVVWNSIESDYMKSR